MVTPKAKAEVATKVKTKAKTEEDGCIAIGHSLPCVETQNAGENLTPGTNLAAGRKPVNYLKPL